MHRQTSNIIRTLVGNNNVDQSDVVGAPPVGAAPTTFSFSIWHLASMDLLKTTAGRDEKHLSFVIHCGVYKGFDCISCCDQLAIAASTITFCLHMCQNIGERALHESWYT